MKVTVTACLNIAALLVTVSAAAAQRDPQAPPLIRATLTLRIDGAQHHLSRIGSLGISADGSIVATQPDEANVRLFGATGAEIKRIDRDGNGEPFVAVHTAGWIGDTLWINDNRVQRLTLVGPGGSPSRAVSMSFPLTVPPGQSVRETTEDFGPTVVGMYSDGSFLFNKLLDRALAIPAAWKQPPGTRTVLARVGTDGRIGSVLAWVPASDVCSGIVHDLCNRVYWSIRDDGREAAFAKVDATTAGYGMIDVFAVGAAGDTVFSRQLPNFELDSATSTPVAAKRYPPVRGVLCGTDGTIWIALQANDSIRIWIVLDKTGTVKGLLKLPTALSVRVANETSFWAVEDDDISGVVAGPDRMSSSSGGAVRAVGNSSVESIVRYSIERP